MSFIYPRTVSISRPTQTVGLGNIGYAAELPATEEQIASCLPASIQLDKSKGGQDAKLPGDASKTLWKILVPLSAIRLGCVQTRDIVTDDQGIRYQVTGPYWNSLGYNLLCEQLES